MDYRPYTPRPARLSPRFRANLLGIAWRLLLPVLVVLVVAAGLEWWQTQAAASAATAAAATAAATPATPAALGPPDFSDLADAVAHAFILMVFLPLCLVSFGVLVVLQALLSPLPVHRRYLSGRPWVYALPGAAAFGGLLYVFRGDAWLVGSEVIWGLLAGGVLALASPGLVEWISKPRAVPRLD